MTQGKSRDDVIQQDVADLHKLGYAQELYRSMGGFSNFAISFSIISILTGAVILYNYGLALGGPAAVGIGWPLVTVFTLLIAASMAEIASAYPTAGGLYYWASRLRNKDWGWWTAWLNLGGQISIVAGINYAAAFYIGATILGPLFGFDPNAETAGPDERHLAHRPADARRDRVQRRRHEDRRHDERHLRLLAHRPRHRDRGRALRARLAADPPHRLPVPDRAGGHRCRRARPGTTSCRSGSPGPSP